MAKKSSSKLSTSQAIILVLGILVPVVVLALYSLGGTRYAKPPASAYFYDLGSSTLFVADNTLPPPIPAPSGALPKGGDAGVRAFVFSCGACNEKERFIAYLMRFSPRYQQVIASTDPDARDRAIEDLQAHSRIHEGEYYRTVEESPTWYPGNSKDAAALLSSPAEKCGGWNKVRTCNP